MSHSPLHRTALLLSVALLSASCGGPAAPRPSLRPPPLDPNALLEETGTLASDDRTIGGGVFSDRFEVPVTTGARLTIELVSTDFDPVLDVSAPGAAPVTNDDWEGDRTRSRIELVVTEAGVLKVQVSSYAARATGTYQVTVRTDRPNAPIAPPPHVTVPAVPTVPTVPDGQPVVLTPGQSVQGAIEATDARAFDGSFADTLRIDSTAHEQLTIRVSSPTGDRLRALCIDSTGRSIAQQSNGIFTVEGGSPIVLQVLAAAPGQTAHWAVGVTQNAPVPPTPSPVAPAGTNHAVPATPPANVTTLQLGQPATGTLAAGDLVLSEQEFADVYAFDAQAGTRVRAELGSTALDTYLIIIAPDGTRQEDDDGATTGRDSLLVFPVTVTGRYLVYATSYSANETGAYTLTVAQPPVALPPNNQHQTIRGQLKHSDAHRPSGELADTFVFNLTAGTTVHFEATSAAFDTFLIVESPTAAVVTDDDSGGGTQAMLDYEVQVTGPHRVTVSSYRSGMLGNYILQIDGASRGTPLRGHAPPAIP